MSDENAAPALAWRRLLAKLNHALLGGVRAERAHVA